MEYKEGKIRVKKKHVVAVVATTLLLILLITTISLTKRISQEMEPEDKGTTTNEKEIKETKEAMKTRDKEKKETMETESNNQTYTIDKQVKEMTKLATTTLVLITSMFIVKSIFWRRYEW